MENYFCVDFMDQSIFIPKSNVDFTYGLGVVAAFFTCYTTEGDLIEAPIIGVVDENFNVILDYRHASNVSKIKLFPEGKMLCVLDVYQNFEYPNFNVVLIDKDKNISYLGADDFRVVDDELVILKTMLGNRALYSLSNVREGESGSQMYNYIGDFAFHEEFGCEVAEAGIFIHDGDNKEDFSILTFYINKSDRIVSGYTFKDQVYDGSMALAEVLENIYRGRI